MYKIMLVDDEVWVRRSLKEQIRWNFLKAELVGEASDGESAYRMALELKPDVILTDIKMPLMNGIEFMERINADLPHLKIIVISGHAEFEWIRQAMVHRAVNYILKPIGEQDLNQSLSAAIRDIEKLRMEREEQLQLKGALNQSLPALKEQYLNAMLTEQQVTSARFQRLMAQLNLRVECHAFHMAVVHIRHYDRLAEEKFEGDDQLLYYAIDNIIGMLRFDSISLLSFRSSAAKNEQILFIGYLPGTSPNACADYAEEAVGQVRSSLKSALNADTCAGIGKGYFQPEDIPNSFLEAAHALKYAKSGNGPETIFFDEIKKKEKDPKDDLVENVAAYIKENFKEQITLESVAQRFAVNASYLSRIFKSESGENFIDYVTRLRIEKASKLMLNPHLKTYEIAEIVGYENTNYFSKVFKKAVGFTPTEYRERFMEK
ncbi:response regulator [Cohnella phaseoli]|uniref:AraC family two component transcriptional regulator n=1 Tax=Cohnella phaseoli TaxID=456490 RepID=A0A3D9IHF5_9BACL|nr:response regulator [Cohnella phaseoli]RED60576.1 AraC family two component transcriptional regulator [Cohnella phaseoli]